MKSVKNNPFLFLTGRLLLLFLTIAGVEAQSAEETQKLIAKYPDNSIVVGNRQLDVTIEMQSGKPTMIFNDYKEYIALSDNAGYYADDKAFFSNLFEMKKLEAYSLVPVGDQLKKIPVTKFNKTAETGNNLFYDDQYTYNYTFPSVVKGTRMITKSVSLTNDTMVPIKFYFANYFPAERLSLTITCPDNVNLTYKLFGYDTAGIIHSYSEKKGLKIYSWQVSESRSYARDNLAPDLDYFMPHIIVHISDYTFKDYRSNVLGTLDDLYKWNYSNISNLNQVESGEVKSLSDSLCTAFNNEEAKVRSMFDWVQKNIKYVAIEDGKNGYVPREASLVLKRRYGDCKDKTSLLVEMLTEQGINSSFAWVGSRHIPYRYSEFPSTCNDDHMIAVWWKDKDTPIFLDGTTTYHSLYDIPSFIQGKQCIIARGEKDYLLYTIPVAPPENNTVYDSLSIELKGDTIIGSGMAVFTGERKAEMLWYFSEKDTNDYPRIFSDQMPKASNKFIVESVEKMAVGNADEPIKFKYTFCLPDYLTASRNVTYLNMNLDRFPSEVNLREDRWMPVEAEYTHKHIFVCNFLIPDHYKVQEVPEDIQYDGPGFGFRQQYVLSGREIRVRTTFYSSLHLIEGQDLVLFREMLTLLNSRYLKSIPLYKSTLL
jgi:hypothetical protein